MPLLLSALVLSGFSCGSAGPKPVFPVRGQVLVEGKPAAGLLVVFHRISEEDPEEQRPSAETDADGRFVLTTYTAKDGAPEGDYLVTVLEVGSEGQRPDESGPASSKGRLPRIAELYGKPGTTNLKVRVNPEPNELEPFQLRAWRGGPVRPAPPPLHD